MADTQPTPAEPETAKLAGLNVSADSKTANGTKLSATASSFAPGKFSSAGDEEFVSSGKSEDKKEELLRVFSMMWFMRPSKIQNEALPLLLKNPPNNVVGQLPSGTGKTAAFILNILQRVNLASNKRQAIFAAPFDNGSSLLVSKAQHRQASASSLP